MEHAQFERLKVQVAAASARQTIELEDLIQQVAARQFAEIALARRTIQTLTKRTCPHCQSNDILLHGKDENGRQRFKCRGCRKTYNILTGTPMARARMPEKWGSYLDCMTEHMTVRNIVASGIGLHQVTAWRWRQRFLRAAANDNDSVLCGVVEANETFFPRSFKGKRNRNTGKPPENQAARSCGQGETKGQSSRERVPVLTAVDSGGSVFQLILESVSDIEAALDGRIGPGSVLCSDGRVAYVKVADKANLEHYAVFVPATTMHPLKNTPDAAAYQIPGRLGLWRVNNHHQRLKYLINERCRGVATRYLASYLGWHRAMVRPSFAGKTFLLQSLV